jgi:eukaryotic-like serine/threonine-protein kinase
MLIGRTVGHYQITAALGAGGMGEVYRATDMTLGREVAIKVLPADVASDPERLARFRREARVLASLNHPNIAAIHGFEEVDGTAFLTLELVEGEDLAERLRRGPVPTGEAIEIAKQVAEALEAAHERGVIHRDLKPANIKVTPAGMVKVLDFGLAKAWAGDDSGEHPLRSPSLSPTFARDETAAGVILGTAAYMSPEQARGRVVDRRADIWAFGVVVVEMLTGRGLFHGETITDVIAAVVTAEPDLSTLPPDTPSAVRRLLRRCLQKDPRVRLPDIGSARVELSEVLSGVSDEDGLAASGVATAPAVRPSRPALTLLGGVLLLGALIGAYVAGRRATPAAPPVPVVRFSMPLEAGLQLDPNAPPHVSPDGRYLLLEVQNKGRWALWMRRMDSLELEALAGTDDGVSPFWSPDSRYIAFVAGQQLKRFAVGGGGVQTLGTLDSSFVGGGAWSPAGTIVLSKGRAGQNTPEGATLVTIPASGGAVRPLTTLDPSLGETGHHSPLFLPDGRHLAFTVAGNAAAAGAFTIALDAPTERRRLLAERTVPEFARGHVLFVRSNTLLALRFDERTREVRGESRAIAENVAVFAPAGLGRFSASSAGLIAYIPAVPSDAQLAWVTRSGAPLSTIGEPQQYGQIALSPDNKQVAVELQKANGDYNIWIVDVARGVPTRMTFGGGSDRNPVWSPDGSQIVFGSTRDGPFALYRKSVTDGRPEVRLFETTEALYPENWTPDGRSIVYQNAGTPEKGRTAWIRPLDGPSTATPIVDIGFNVDELQVSPDGRLLAYISAESGRYEVYLSPLDGAGRKVRVSIDGGGQPKWRRDGRELFFVSRGKVHAVEIRPGADPVVGLPEPLFELWETGPDFDDYAPSADGQRFLVKRPIADKTASVHVLMHWDQ